jgi:hypothetical protein
MDKLKVPWKETQQQRTPEKLEELGHFKNLSYSGPLKSLAILNI